MEQNKTIKEMIEDAVMEAFVKHANGQAALDTEPKISQTAEASRADYKRRILEEDKADFMDQWSKELFDKAIEKLENSEGKIIYVATPVRPKCGDMQTKEFRDEFEHNIAQARLACEIVKETGNTPISSILFCKEFLNEYDPEDRAIGMKIGRDLLSVSDELWVFGNEISEGMAEEIYLAAVLGMPVRIVKTFSDEEFKSILKDLAQQEAEDANDLKQEYSDPEDHPKADEKSGDDADADPDNDLDDDDTDENLFDMDQLDKDIDIVAELMRLIARHPRL